MHISTFTPRLGVIVALIWAAGCQPRQGVSRRPESLAPAISNEFVSEQYGVKLSIPRGWSPRPSDDFVLELSPATDALGGASAQAPTISLDVPKLPPHLPGMIRMGLIENGLLDDLRKQFRDVRLLGRDDQEIPGTQTRAIKIAWQAGSEEFLQHARLMIHGGRVYIVRATALVAQFERTSKAYDEVIQSLVWTR